MADIPCAGCAYPAACDGRCAYDWVDAEITRIVAEHHPPEPGGREAAFHEKEEVDD